MSTNTQVPEIESIIEIGRPGVLKPTSMREQTVQEIHRKVYSTVPDVGNQSIITTSDETTGHQLVEALWPLQKSFGHVQIRGREGELHIFDTLTKTMTDSPVRQVLRAAKNSAGETCILVYGDILGHGRDDMYAWISTTTGSRMHVQRIGGNADENPINHAPEGFEIMAAA